MMKQFVDLNARNKRVYDAIQIKDISLEDLEAALDLLTGGEAELEVGPGIGGTLARVCIDGDHWNLNGDDWFAVSPPNNQYNFHKFLFVRNKRFAEQFEQCETASH